ncbi:MAG TPA: GNAT family N-acetyltransferase [Steroidobacteraceae bacterium]|nr:GNAT family N-acetyltransferase [Steroidobacteraceae bacterium]
MNLIETARLNLRRLGLHDASFILELLNEPTFIRFIGDKGVRSLKDACDYLEKGPIGSYRRFGFGLYLTSLRASGEPIGICGLVKRDALQDVDVGFALMPQFAGFGYATESAAAVLAYGKREFGLKRIVGITDPDNHASIAVLRKIGLRFERNVALELSGEEVQLFGPAGAAPS